MSKKEIPNKIKDVSKNDTKPSADMLNDSLESPKKEKIQKKYVPNVIAEISEREAREQKKCSDEVDNMYAAWEEEDEEKTLKTYHAMDF